MDHRLHHQRGRVRPGAAPVRAGGGVRPLRQPRCRPVQRPPAPDDDGRARRRRRRPDGRAGPAQRARLRDLDGRDGRPGAGPALPRAGAGPRARRHRRGRARDGAARSARLRRASAATRCPAAPGRSGSAGRCSPRPTGASTRSRRARCSSPSAPTGPRRTGCSGTGGPAPRTTRPAGWRRCRRRRWCCTASTTPWCRWRTPSTWPGASPTPSSPSCPARVTPTCGSSRSGSASLLLDWLARRGEVPAGQPLAGLAGHAERLSRAAAVPLGALRAPRTAAGLLAGQLRRR